VDSWGEPHYEPVAAYPTREAAEQAIADAEKAREKLAQLEKELIPERPEEVYPSSEEKNGRIHPSSNGLFYNSAEAAAWADAREAFYKRPDVIALQEESSAGDCVMTLPYIA